MDAFIDSLNNIGGVKKIVDTWVSNPSTSMPKFEPVKNPKFKLRLATTGDIPPYSFFKDNVLSGIDIELASRLAQYMNAELEINIFTWDSIVAATESNMVDILMSNLNQTEERKKMINFSKPYRFCKTALLVPKSNYVKSVATVVKDNDYSNEDKSTSIFSSLKASLERTLIREDRYKMVIGGLLVTIIISLLSGFFGTIVGFVICMFRRSHNRPSAAISAVFIRIIQGTPIVVLLMILYYIIFGNVDISGIAVAIIGFSINFGVYASEIMRSGMDAVDKGQVEAAKALGYNNRQAFVKILLPQAAVHFIPVLKGEFISMVKMTSVVGFISVMDLTKVSDIIRSRTMEAFFPLILTAIIYFVVANVFTYALVVIDKKVDPKLRPRKIKRL